MFSRLVRNIESRQTIHRVLLRIWRLFPPRLAGFLKGLLGRSWVLGAVAVAALAWGLGLSNRRRFAANFMLITVTTTFIILVVRSSVALSLVTGRAFAIERIRAGRKKPGLMPCL